MGMFGRFGMHQHQLARGALSSLAPQAWRLNLATVVSRASAASMSHTVVKLVPQRLLMAPASALISHSNFFPSAMQSEAQS